MTWMRGAFANASLGMKLRRRARDRQRRREQPELFRQPRDSEGADELDHQAEGRRRRPRR